MVRVRQEVILGFLYGFRHKLDEVIVLFLGFEGDKEVLLLDGEADQGKINIKVPIVVDREVLSH